MLVIMVLLAICTTVDILGQKNKQKKVLVRSFEIIIFKYLIIKQ